MKKMAFSENGKLVSGAMRIILNPQHTEAVRKNIYGLSLLYRTENPGRILQRKQYVYENVSRETFIEKHNRHKIFLNEKNANAFFIRHSRFEFFRIYFRLVL